MSINSVILHNIRSTHNVGSVLRSAECFGVSLIYIGGFTPYPRIKQDSRLPHIIEKQTRAIAKTSLGAENLIPIEIYKDIDILISNLTSKGRRIIALEQSSRSVPLDKFMWKPSDVLLIGSELGGIIDQLLDKSDHIVEIAHNGKKESLNVSVATGIALYSTSV